MLPFNDTQKHMLTYSHPSLAHTEYTHTWTRTAHHSLFLLWVAAVIRARLKHKRMTENRMTKMDEVKSITNEHTEVMMVICFLLLLLRGDFIYQRESSFSGAWR